MISAAVVFDVLCGADEFCFQLLIRQAELHLRNPVVEAGQVWWAAQISLVSVRDEVLVMLLCMRQGISHLGQGGWRRKRREGVGPQQHGDAVGVAIARDHVHKAIAVEVGGGGHGGTIADGKRQRPGQEAAPQVRPQA